MSDLSYSVFVDEEEESIESSQTNQYCREKGGAVLSSFICGLCNIDFSTICKLHDHFEIEHFTGAYIFYQNIKTGYPRLESSCKYTQTDLVDLIDNDQIHFKGDIDEVNDTDEYELESGFDTIDTNVKTDGTGSNDKNVQGNLESHEFKEGKLKRKRKKAKYKRETQENGASIITNKDGLTKLRLYLPQRKSKKNRSEKESHRNKRNLECLITSDIDKQSTAGGDEDGCGIESVFENVENHLDQSEVLIDNNPKVAANIDVISNNKTCSYEQFTAINGTFSQKIGKHQEAALPSQVKLKEKRSSKKICSGNKIQEVNNDNSASYSCVICDTQYSSKKQLRYHMGKVHAAENTDDQKECKWCGKSFPGFKSYTAHQRQCKKNKYLMCLICEKKFDSRFEVADHLKTHRNTNDLKCRLCERMFECELTLQSHLRRHNQRKDLQCEHCGRSFYNHNLLKKHKLYCNREPDIDCPHCTLKFKTQDSLKHHMSVHSNERPFVCHVCGYAAKKSMYLKRHLRSHTGERPYICAQCGMSFAAANGLNRHKKTHTNTKPCVCQYCGKSFTNNWNLKTHLRQHTGDAPYKCGQCGKAFKQNVLLKLHNKSHHPVASILLQ